MRVITPQITWHNRDPVLCADFDPTVCLPQSNPTTPPGPDGEPEPEKLVKPFYRVVTGGADSHLVVWHLSDFDTLKPELVCVADLTRHTKAVNAVRFSPDGSYLASADDDAYIYIWKHDKEKDTAESECWNVEKGLRKHLEDVADLSWSGDGNFLVSASVDNTAVLWDVKKGAAIHIWSEHVGFVQGASFDPLGEFVATMATDRNLRVYNPKSGKVISKTLKYPKIWLPNAENQEPDLSTPFVQETPTPVVSNETESNPEETPTKSAKKSKKLPPGFVNRLFQDDTMKTFCRRLNFSPKGEFLVVPGGLLPPNPLKDKSQNSTESNSTPVPSTSVKKKKKNGFLEKDQMDQNNNAVVLFCRNSFTHPCGLIPTGTSYSIGSRFCPVYFQRGREPVGYDTTVVNPTRKSERLISCTGRIRKPRTGKNLFLDMPYRMVFAVITNKEVLLCDTESLEPMGIVKNIHCTRMSDLTWSPDGRILFVTSTDGYCTILSFGENELGVPVKEELPPLDINAFPVPPPPAKPKKEPKKKEPKAKKPKEVANVGEATPGAEIDLSDAPEIKTPKTKKSSKKSKKKQDKNELAKPKPLFFFGTPSTPTKPEVTLPKPSYSAPASPAFSTPTSSKNNSPENKSVTETSDQAKSPQQETPKSAPKRATFMDKWVIKTPKAGDSDANTRTPNSARATDPKMPTLKKEDSDIEIVYEDMKSPTVPPVLKPQVVRKYKEDEPGFDEFDFPVPSSQDAIGSLSQELINKLKNAPIKVDLEAEAAVNQSSIILSSETYEKSKETLSSQQPAEIVEEASSFKPVDAAETVKKTSCSKTATETFKEFSDKPIETKNLEPSVSTSTSLTPPKTGEKRPATSPLSSEQKKKQPRRVQFITLSSKPGGDGAGSGPSTSDPSTKQKD